jgi:hypothetical protein
MHDKVFGDNDDGLTDAQEQSKDFINEELKQLNVEKRSDSSWFNK